MHDTNEFPGDLISPTYLWIGPEAQFASEPLYPGHPLKAGPWMPILAGTEEPAKTRVCITCVESSKRAF